MVVKGQEIYKGGGLKQQKKLKDGSSCNCVVKRWNN